MYLTIYTKVHVVCYATFVGVLAFPSLSFITLVIYYIVSFNDITTLYRLVLLLIVFLIVLLIVFG